MSTNSIGINVSSYYYYTWSFFKIKLLFCFQKILKKKFKRRFLSTYSRNLYGVAKGVQTVSQSQQIDSNCLRFVLFVAMRKSKHWNVGSDVSRVYMQCQRFWIVDRYAFTPYTTIHVLLVLKCRGNSRRIPCISINVR